MSSTSVSTSTLTFLSIDRLTPAWTQIVQRNQGFVVGEPRADHALTVFRMASRALAAAAEIQADAGTEADAPRMAIHTGDAVLTEQGYEGPVVARVMTLRESSEPGQILVSGTAALLASEFLPRGSTLVELSIEDADEQDHVSLLRTTDGSTPGR